MKTLLLVLWALLCGGSAFAAMPNVEEIVKRSVANNDLNWKAAPQYTFTERDVTTKSGQKKDQTYHVSMIDGSPYNKLIAVDGEPLSRAQAANEERKLEQ